jgi:NAD(P)-dependent dehydrogenase (short-subunit alcohol dehydrogenase family)
VTRSLTTDLAGQRALVAGGARGIGAATATALAAAGARVVVSARSAPPDHPFPVIETDASDPRSVSQLADRARELLGGVDLFVSNVGGQVRRPSALAFSDADWQLELDVNLLAAVCLDRELVPAMLERGHGSVVHVSSGAARIARPPSLAYTASKAALNAYSKGLATEVASRGGTGQRGFPGPDQHLTGHRACRRARHRPDALTRRIAEDLKVPVGRAGTSEEMAQAIVFLLSPAAAYIVGANLIVDGGAFPTV